MSCRAILLFIQSVSCVSTLLDFRISCFAIRTQIVVERCCCCRDCGYASQSLLLWPFTIIIMFNGVHWNRRLWKGLMDDAKGDLMAIGSASSQNKQWNWRRWRHEEAQWMWPLIDFVRMVNGVLVHSTQLLWSSCWMKLRVQHKSHASNSLSLTICLWSQLFCPAAVHHATVSQQPKHLPKHTQTLLQATVIPYVDQRLLYASRRPMIFMRRINYAVDSL